MKYFTLNMKAILIPIYFDYASTLCYVAWRIVRELEAEVGFEALWKGVPIRLRDNRSRPGNVLGPIERMKVMNVIAETGIRVKPPERWIDSEAALMGSELAREAMRFAPYHEGMVAFCGALATVLATALSCFGSRSSRPYRSCPKKF